MQQYILAIDQGTTSSRAILFDEKAHVVSSAQKEFTQIFRHPGWVEHDANEIWLSVLSCISSCLQNSHVSPECVKAIGITNQRETAVVWDKQTGLPVANAIVWQSRQTAELCDELKKNGLEETVRKKTGLTIDPYFSATKIRWILDHVENGQQRAENGELLAGTIDSWIMYCFSGKKDHVTDFSNAARTMLFNIHEKQWDAELCKMLDIPMYMLPEVKENAGVFTYTAPYHFFGQSVPITGVAGDQQASLFGLKCFRAGQAKNTYGTGCFLLMNTGTEAKTSEHGLVTTIAWSLNHQVYYALEGSVFVAGSAIQWLRDQMQFFPKASMSQEYAEHADANSGVIMVPAFTGLGAPYWDDKCRGAIFGITRGTTQQDITKACLESLAYQTKDVLVAMEQDTGRKISYLKVDGGASMNDYLMQFQCNLLQCGIHRPANIESTSLGAAYLAGIGAGIWSLEDLMKDNEGMTSYCVKEQADIVENRYAQWKKAVQAARVFTNE